MQRFLISKKKKNHGEDQASRGGLARSTLPHGNMRLLFPPGVPGKMPGNQAGKSRGGSMAPDLIPLLLQRRHPIKWIG